jgi:histidyl-tRNA synthetase
MALSTQPYKGARDFYPEDKRIQKYMFSKMRTTVERFGYEEYDAPILEPLEVYLAKSSEEIANEQTYTFTDRGGRQVAIRPEMTPTVSRMVAAKRQELSYPVRWYSIPNLWRYERPQRGRLREHWQLNVDIFGVDGIAADHEIILIADQILRSFGAKQEMYTIKVNSRKLINALMQDELGLDKTQSETLVRLIDRMHKMEYAEFVGHVDTIFTPTQRDAGAHEKLLQTLHAKTLDELPPSLKLHPSIGEITELMKLLYASGISNAVFDITLMRGFDYYTDIVFEVFDNSPENNRSMFGGGRYDGLVGLFGVEPVPTVGFGMGDVTLQNFLEVHDLLPKQEPETEVYAVLIGDDIYSRSQRVFSELRRMGVRVAIDTTNRKPEKQLKTAIKKGIHYAIFIGERELGEEQFMIKNLKTAQEERHGLQRIVSIVKRRDKVDIEDE